MRLGEFYDVMLRRDVVDRTVVYVVRELNSIKGLFSYMTCSGLQSIAEFDSLRCLLLMELLCGRKGFSGVGFKDDAGSRLRRQFQGTFICRVSYRNKWDIFNFCDSWSSVLEFFYVEKEGSIQRKAGKLENLFYSFYKDVGNHLEFVGEFYTLRINFFYVVEFKWDSSVIHFMDGLRLI